MKIVPVGAEYFNSDREMDRQTDGQTWLN